MHSLESLREIRSLEFALGIMPGESICQDHMTFRELAYGQRNAMPQRPLQGEKTGCMTMSLKTGEISVYVCKKCDKPANVKCDDYKI